MPTINKRFLFQLLLIFAVLTGSIVGIHTIQARRIPGALKGQADRAAEQGKLDAAIHYLKQYLDFKPDDLTALEQLAQYQKERSPNDHRGALLIYDRILRSDPSRSAIRREALSASLMMNRFSDAETHASVLLAESPKDAELWRYQAAAKAGLQKTSEARESYTQSIKFGPTDPLTYQKYAQYLWKDLKLTAEAKTVVEQLVTALPSNPESYLTRARYGIYTQDEARVVPDLKKTLELEPTQPDALLMLSDQYQKTRQSAEARDLLMKGVEAHPLDSRFVRNLAWLELHRGNIGSALATLENGLDRVKSGFDLMLPLADLLIQLGETARTEEIIRKLEAKSSTPARLQVQYLKARVAMRQNQWADAVTRLTELRTAAVNLPVLETQIQLLLGICYQRQGDTVREREALKLLLNKDPNHVAGRVALAQSYLNNGDLAEAMLEYQSAVQSPYASPGTHASLLRLKAREYRLAAARPNDWQQLERVAGELSRAFGPSSSEPVLLRAELAEARGDLTQAVAVLRAEAARRPGDTKIWAALAQRTADLAGTEAGIAILDEAQASSGDGADLRLARAHLYAQDPTRLRAIDPLAGQIDTWSDADQIRLLFGLIEVHDRLGEDRKALAAYQLLVALRPTDLGIWEPLAERAARVGDAHAFKTARQTIAQLDPTNASGLVADAWQALASKNADEMRSIREKLIAQMGATPNRADACLVLGRLAAAAGDNAQAQTLYDRAVRLEPTRFGPAQASLASLVRNENDDGTRRMIARLTHDYRWAGEPFRRVVRHACRELSPEQQAKLLAAISPILETESSGPGWLSDAYQRAGMKTEALRWSERAVASKTATSDDYYRLVRRQMEQGDSTAALATMTRARQQLPVGAYYALAASVIESEAIPRWTPESPDPATLRMLTQARLGLKLSRYQRAEAIALLDDFQTKIPATAKVEGAWARRNLAMLLAIQTDAKDRQRAVKLLLSSDDSPGETPEEKRSTAAVLTSLARHLDGENRTTALNRATKVLQALVAETRSPRDAYLLAHLYRAAGNRTASAQVLNQLLQADPRNIEYYLMALDELTDGGNLEAAEPFSQRLQALAPSEFRVIAAVGRYECKAGRPEKALAMIERYTRAAEQSAGDFPARSARAAELLDEFCRMPTVRNTEVGKRMAKLAIERYEALIPTRPESVVPTAGLLAQDGRVVDAFALIEKNTSAISAAIRCSAGLAILRNGTPSDQQFSVVRGWLDTALAADPDAPALLMNEGEYYTLRQEYTKAAAAYDKVLRANPRNVVALNNLAWILAPRPESAERALQLIDRAVAEIGWTGELLDTRARVRIASKDFTLAEKDLLDALSQEKTPLRMFHLALAKAGQSPPRADEAQEAFRNARSRGLDPKAVHPADLPSYRALEAQSQSKPN